MGWQDGLKRFSAPKTTPMPVPHLPTHNQSTGIHVVKSSASATQCITICIINGGAQCKFVVLVFKQRSVSWDSDALRRPATAYAPTLGAIFWDGHRASDLRLFFADFSSLDFYPVDFSPWTISARTFIVDCWTLARSTFLRWTFWKRFIKTFLKK